MHLGQDEEGELGQVDAADDAEAGSANQATILGLAGESEPDEGGEQDEVGRVCLPALVQGPSMQLPLKVRYQASLHQLLLLQD